MNSEQTALEAAETARLRNEFLLKVSLVVLALLGVNLVFAWVIEFYNHGLVVANMSFRGFDPSWIPQGTYFRPAVGHHYFGDFEQYMGYATSTIPPYSSAIVHPAAYGPTAVVLVKLLNDAFGWPGAVIVFLPLAVVFIFWGFLKLLGPSLHTVLLTLLLLMTNGFVIAFDRGNLQVAVAALCIWFCVGFLNDRPILSLACLAFAITLKLYVAVLVLLLIKEQRWREILQLVGATAALYLIGFLVVGGNLVQSLRNFIRVDLEFSHSTGHSNLLTTVSSVSTIYKFLFLAWGPQHFNHFRAHSPGWYLLVPGLITAAICIAVIWLSGSTREIALVAALAMMQLIPQGAYPYVDINTAIELCLLVRLATAAIGPNRSKSIGGNAPIRRSIVVACVIILVVGSAPWVMLFYGSARASTSAADLLSPLSNMVVICLLLIGLLVGRYQKAPGRHVASRSIEPSNSAEARL